MDRHLTRTSAPSVVFGLFRLLQVHRAALEEAVLSATFPDYARYKQRTPALIPWSSL